MDEQKIDVKAAVEFWERNLSDVTSLEGKLLSSANAARVGLALMKAWEEVETQFIRNAEDGVRATALCIAVRHGLPVEEEK